MAVIAGLQCFWRREDVESPAVKTCTIPKSASYSVRIRNHPSWRRPACALQSFMDLQYALTFGKVETDGHRLLHTDPVSWLEIAERAHFLQRHCLAVLDDLPGRAGGRGEAERIGRSGEGGGEGDGALASFDLRQLTGESWTHLIGIGAGDNI